MFIQHFVSPAISGFYFCSREHDPWKFRPQALMVPMLESKGDLLFSGISKKFHGVIQDKGVWVILIKCYFC